MPDAVSPEFLALQQALLGRYSIERELGRGGMGIVFLARDLALDRPVALKLLPPSLAARPALRDRFVREAQTAAKLSQPNIVPIHSVETTGDLVWFAMAYIEGETLGERLRSRGALTPQETARLVQEVAWALGYAHGRNVVHRDIKPDNIMIERGSGRAMVMDFGIASRTAEDADREILGTAQYISPEQASGEPVDGRSDIYSLGVVAFLSLTGRLPFEGDTASLLAQHITKAPPPVASVAPGMPRKLAQAIDRCLAKQPSDRFPDGEALAESVAQAIEQRRELPVPVRLWLKTGIESRLAYLAWYGMLGPMSSWMVGAGTGALFGSFAAGAVVGVGTYLLLPPTAHFLHRIRRLRRLLEEGYTVDDARYALQDLAERRREELSYEFGDPPRWARVVRKLMITSAGVGVIGLLLAMGAPGIGDSVVMVSVGALVTWLGSAVLQVVRPGLRVTEDPYVKRRLRFWNGRMAKWFEKLARIGLRRRAIPADMTYRPTELAIGMAADAMFESLPKEQRKELKELPALIERLQRDAQLMRRTVDELNGALAGLGDQSAAARSSALAGQGGPLATTRDRLAADLTRKRDEAASRLATAVTAIEGIRLNLLRLRAGTGTVAELTADLDAARRAEEQIEIVVSARQEVDALLKGARASTGSLRPVTPHG